MAAARLASAHAGSSRRRGAGGLARRPQCSLSVRRPDHRRAPGRSPTGKGRQREKPRRGEAGFLRGRSIGGDFDRRLYEHRPRGAVLVPRQHRRASVEPAVRRRGFGAAGLVRSGSVVGAGRFPQAATLAEWPTVGRSRRRPIAVRQSQRLPERRTQPLLAIYDIQLAAALGITTGFAAIGLTGYTMTPNQAAPSQIIQEMSPASKRSIQAGSWWTACRTSPPAPSSSPCQRVG